MGYYTCYEIDYTFMDEPPKDKKYLSELDWAMAAALYEINDSFDNPKDMVNYASDPSFIFKLMVSFDEMKWYDHDINMIELSLRFPNVLFTLTGYGEENDDIWRAYYLNGTGQYSPARIDFASPDMGLLLTNPKVGTMTTIV